MQQRSVTDTNTDRVAVAVVGGGPIGLTTFIALRRSGADAVLLERHPDTATIPKALLRNERTMEVVRQLGLEEDVRGCGTLRRRGWLSVLRQQPSRPSTTSVSPCCTARRVLARGPSSAARTRWNPCCALTRSGWRLATCGSQPAGRAHPGRRGADLRILEGESGDGRRLRADHVVAADGSRSAVRELLGIAMRGDEALKHSMHVIFEAPLSPLVATGPARCTTSRWTAPGPTASTPCCSSSSMVTDGGG